MMEQDLSALWTTARTWLHIKLFDAPTLQALHEANSSCLDALLRAHLQSLADGTPSPLPQQISSTLVNLDAAQRNRVACCPFAIFNANFTDGPFWQTLLHNRRLKNLGHLPNYGPATREHLLAFAREALFCAWYLVRSNPRAARAMFGMSAAVVEVFEQFTPGRLLAFVDEHPDLVTLRAQHSPLFWLALLAAAKRGNGVELEHVHALGMLILAGECFTQLEGC